MFKEWCMLSWSPLLVSSSPVVTQTRHTRREYRQDFKWLERRIECGEGGRILGPGNATPSLSRCPCPFFSKSVPISRIITSWLCLPLSQRWHIQRTSMLHIWKPGEWVLGAARIASDASKQLASSVCGKVSRDVAMRQGAGEGRGVRQGQGDWETRVGSKFPLFYRRFHLFPRKYC